MNDELDQLERRVEQEAQLLGQLPAVPPRPECVARVKAAVKAEAARLGGATPRWRSYRRWMGTAAAALLALGLSQLFTSPLPTGSTSADDVEVLNLWARAVGESSDTLTFLLDDGWLLNGTGQDDELQWEYEGLLDSLEQSFELFETM